MTPIYVPSAWVMDARKEGWINMSKHIDRMIIAIGIIILIWAGLMGYYVGKKKMEISGIKQYTIETENRR